MMSNKTRLFYDDDNKNYVLKSPDTFCVVVSYFSVPLNTRSETTKAKSAVFIHYQEKSINDKNTVLSV